MAYYMALNYAIIIYDGLPYLYDYTQPSQVGQLPCSESELNLELKNL